MAMDNHKEASRLKDKVLFRCGLYEEPYNPFSSSKTKIPHGATGDELSVFRSEFYKLDDAHLKLLLNWLEDEMAGTTQQYRIYHIGGDLIILASVVIAFIGGGQAWIWITLLYLFGGYTILHTRLKPWREQRLRLGQFIAEISSALRMKAVLAADRAAREHRP
jgi:hypothetical protein